MDLIKIVGSFLSIDIRQRRRWQSQFTLYRRLIQRNLIVVEGLDLPLVLVVEVQYLALGLLLSTTRVLLDYFLLDPGLEADVELPASLLELLGCQELLVGVLHVVEHEKQGFLVEPLKVTLSVVHGCCRKVSLRHICWVLTEVHSFINRKWLLWFDDFLILDQRNVDKRRV